MTVPILLTILTSNETESGVLSILVHETVRQFGFDTGVIRELNMRLFGKTVWWLFGNDEPENGENRILSVIYVFFSFFCQRA